MKPFAHFLTITKHRHLVCRYCFRLGLYRQGLFHDLSKYAPTEFFRGAKYYQGHRSPNDAERIETGISMAWLHHKGRNKHHPEYWIDFNFGDDHHDHPMIGQKMPLRYVAEMFCDRLAACRIYMKGDYHDAAAYEYYVKSKPYLLIHPETSREIETMLEVLKESGEEAAFAYVRERLKKDLKEM